MSPDDVDLSDDLCGTFGCIEFEKAACEIVRWLASGAPTLIDDWMIGAALRERMKSPWGKPFRVDAFPGIGAGLFAMLCCAGWIEHVWFPKGVFCVSDKFVARLKEKAK